MPIAASDTASALVGIYVRPYPTASQPDTVQQVGSGKNFPADCLVRGYVTVNIGADASSVARHGPVYMRVATPSAS
ncbi:structural cement protein Gp24, partial [Vibrio parahaemolyticus]|uniref:structural cement protein Gp24 n=1 Tax=Vibrio parahaemolyticus TaxID=670 RepID=UPI001A904397